MKTQLMDFSNQLKSTMVKTTRMFETPSKRKVRQINEKMIAQAINDAKGKTSEQFGKTVGTALVNEMKKSIR